MDTELMREFIFLAEKRNSLKTARHFHISTSTLSRHMAKIEGELGVSLFKNPRTYALSPEGKSAVDHFGNMLVEFDRLADSLSHSTPQTLRVAYALEDRAVARAVLRGRQLFLRSNSRAQINIVIPQERGVMESLEVGDADAAILYLPDNIDEKLFSWRLLLTEPLCAAVPRGSLDSPNEVIPLEALNGFTFFYATKPGYQDYTRYIQQLIEKSGALISSKGIAADNIDDLYSQDAPNRVWFFTESSFSAENRPLFQQAYDSSDLYVIADANADRYLVYRKDTENYLLDSFASCMGQHT